MHKIDYSTYVKPSRFVHLEQGDNRVKIISDGVITYEHGTLIEGRFTPLGTCTEDTTCKYCAKGYEPSVRYKWVVYLPEIKDVRVLAVGPQVGDEICIIGDKCKSQFFEVTINRKGVGKYSRYTVKKAENAEIDESLKELVKQKRDYLVFKYLNK